MKMWKKCLAISLGSALAYFVVLETVSPGYTKRFWLAIDEFANVLLFGDNETISERVARGQAKGQWVSSRVCDFLDLFDEDHCEKVYERNNLGD